MIEVRACKSAVMKASKVELCFVPSKAFCVAERFRSRFASLRRLVLVESIVDTATKFCLICEIPDLCFVFVGSAKQASFSASFSLRYPLQMIKKQFEKAFLSLRASSFRMCCVCVCVCA